MALKRLVRMVEPGVWRASGDALGEERVRRLNDAPAPDLLLDQVVREAEEAARRGSVRLGWEESCERSGYFRLVAQVPLGAETFDWLFNGRSGYRAQYYLSPEEGILFNRDILAGLLPAFEAVFDPKTIPVGFDMVERSVRAPHAKIWIYDDKEAFFEAVEDALSPEEWVKNGAKRGRKAPLPLHLKMDVKGAFIRPETGDIFIDEVKLDRACDLFKCGFV